MTDVRVRFAPSPTGSLHVGSARTALYNYLYARHHGGRMVLRIEDTDLKRSTSAHDASIIDDLSWLGLQADEGPDVGGPYGPYRQSERAHLYEAAVQQLLTDGWAYACFCPQELLEERKEQQLARGVMPKYDRCCTALSAAEVAGRLAAGEPAAIRFRVPTGPSPSLRTSSATSSSSARMAALPTTSPWWSTTPACRSLMSSGVRTTSPIPPVR